MRVLYLTTNSSLLDGINRHILNISKALNREQGINIAICSVHPKGELHLNLESKGIKTYSLNFPNGHSFGIFKAFDKVIFDFKPDIIHSHVMAIIIRLYLSYYKRNIPIIETIHGIPDKKSKISFKDRLEIVINKVTNLNLQARCYISKGVRRSREKDLVPVKYSGIFYNPKDFIQVIPNKILHSLLGLDNDIKIIGTACRICYVKNPEAFTEVMCLALKMKPELHAVVIGEGEEEDILKCKSIVNKHDVENRFHWLGYQSNAPELIAEMDCFIMTSRNEGLPTTILECFAGKTPVAMLEGDGGLIDILELNSKEKPIVVSAPQNNYNELVNKIVHILNNPNFAKQLTDNAFEIGKQNFDSKSVVNKLIRLYQEILNESK